MISFLIHCLFKMVLFNLYKFVNLHIFFSCFFVISIHLVVENILYYFNTFKCIDICNVWAYDPLWRMFHIYLRRMCGLMLLGGVFYRCLKSLFCLHCSATLLFLLICIILSIVKRSYKRILSFLIMQLPLPELFILSCKFELVSFYYLLKDFL